METFGAAATLTDADVARAPDLTIGRNTVRLDGMTYRIHLDVGEAGGRRVTGDLELEASPGKLVPPFEIAGAKRWVTGYVVPVLSGPLRGRLDVAGTAAGSPPATITFDGTGYHDHNWGFWKGVSWQWGQVQIGDLAFLFGRVFPPADAANAERMPGFLGVVGPDGPIGYGTNVRITETNDANGRPTALTVRALGSGLNVTLQLDVTSTETTRIAQGPLANNIDFLQLRGRYTLTGEVARKPVSGTAVGSAETFRGRPSTAD